MPAAPWAADALLVVLRWLHAVATVAFLGWSAVFLLDGPPPGRGARRFKDVTELTLVVLLASGAILAFDRLSRGAGATYALLLALKVACAVLAYQAAFRWRRAGLPPGAPAGRLVLIFGAGAMLLAAILKGVFESGLRGEL